MFVKYEPRFFTIFLPFEVFLETLSREVKRDPLIMESAFDEEVLRFLFPGDYSTFKDLSKDFWYEKPFYKG